MWEATANKRTYYPTLKEEQHCDVVIIGAGFTGLSTSYHLQKKQCKTIVLEKGTVGCGASGRNGGEVLTGYLGSMEYWAKKKGLETAKQMWQLSIDSIDLIESIIEKEHISCDFTRKGSFYAAYKPSHLEGMKREQEFMSAKIGYEQIQIVEPEHLQNELDTTFYYGGHVDERSAHFHPLNYTLGLADAVTKLGGEIYERTKALSYERTANNKIVVKTNDGSVIADEIVIVTNAYAGDLNQTIKQSVVPVESIMIATEPLPEKLIERLIPNNRAVSDSKNLLYYFRRTADHRLAFGGSGRSTSKRDQNRLFSNLHAGMLDVFPQLKDARIEFAWGGKVGFTQTMLPYIGQLDDGAHYAFGYGGHGAAMASMLGKIIAETIVKENKVENPLKIEKLKPIPFHNHHAKAVGILKFYKKFQDIIS